MDITGYKMLKYKSHVLGLYSPTDQPQYTNETITCLQVLYIILNKEWCYFTNVYHWISLRENRNRKAQPISW